MFPGLGLQKVGLKNPRKKYSSSFDMRDTYSKIPRHSVEVGPWNKSQIVEVLLDVTFTIQISNSAGHIDTTSFILSFMFPALAYQRPRSTGKLGVRKTSRMVFQTYALGTQEMSLQLLKSFKFLTVLFAISGLVFMNLLKKPMSRGNISVQKKREFSVSGWNTKVTSHILSTSKPSSERSRGSLVYGPQNTGTRNFSKGTLISYDLGNLLDLIPRELSALTGWQLTSILWNLG
jgi:hypothetical protein